MDLYYLESSCSIIYFFIQPVYNVHLLYSRCCSRYMKSCRYIKLCPKKSKHQRKAKQASQWRIMNKCDEWHKGGNSKCGCWGEGEGGVPWWNREGFREKKILIKVLTNVQKTCQEDNWHLRENQWVYAYQSLLGPWTVSRQCSWAMRCTGKPGVRVDKGRLYRVLILCVSEMQRAY